MLTAEPLDLDYKHEIIRRVHQERDQARVHECREGCSRGRRQAGELLLSRAIQLPPVHASEAVLG